MLYEAARRALRRTRGIGQGGCWLCSGDTWPNGYARQAFKGKAFAVHRLIYECLVGPIPAGLQVLHRCDARACCNPAHLFVGTQRDNVIDAISKGRIVRAPSKEAIESLKSKGITWRALADHFGFHRSTLWRICARRPGKKKEALSLSQVPSVSEL
jgi:hypothetical protein